MTTTPKGRRTRFDSTLRGIADRTAVYDNDDRLVTSGDYAYGFDDDGFLTSKTDTVTQQTTTYSYARTGQLNSIQLPDGTLIEYLHNAAGQRVAKKVNGVITEKYLWAGITGLLAVYDGSDNLLIRFEGQKMVKNGQTYYLVGDQVGSIRAVVDAAGNIVKEINYDSFGNILTDSDPTFTIPLGFAGGLHDRDTGLVRFGFRDYDPNTGTWTTRDPVGFHSGSYYMYSYCGNEPIASSDQFGLYGWYPNLGADTEAAVGLVKQAAKGVQDIALFTVLAYMGDEFPHATVSLNLTGAGGYSAWPNRPGWGGTASLGLYVDTRGNMALGGYLGTGPTLGRGLYGSVNCEFSPYLGLIQDLEEGAGYQLGLSGRKFTGEILLDNQRSIIGVTGALSLATTGTPQSLYAYHTQTKMLFSTNVIKGAIKHALRTAYRYTR